MAYTPFQDGTQKFGIPDSPVAINSVDYIAENIQITHPTSVVEIKDENGVPTGQVIIPENSTGTATLQYADSSTASPARMSVITLGGADWVITEVGDTFTQGQYVKANIAFRLILNPS